MRAGVAGSDSSSDFHQVEAFADWDLPWDWDWGAGWWLQSRLDASAGWLGESEFHSAVLTAGPMLVLRKAGWPVGLEGGISPTVLTRAEFESKDFGIPFQFTTHLGIFWDFSSRFRLGYRYQHMSNAGFAPRNPGLNLHVFSMSYRF